MILCRWVSIPACVALVMSLGGALGAQTPASSPEATQVAPPDPAPSATAGVTAQTAVPAQPQAERAPRAPRPPAEPASPVPPPEPPDVDDDPDALAERGQDIVRVGQDFTLAEGDEASSVVVIMGNATINGRARELVVVMGTVTLGPRARIDQQTVSVLGGVQVSEGAAIGRELVVIGGALDAPPSFRPGREGVVINPPLLGTRVNSLLPYLTQGPLVGRLIVPSLTWLWSIVFVFFVVYVVVNLLVDQPVRLATAAIEDKTLTAFGTGLLVLLLAGPVSFLLAVSLVGILVIPVLACAILAATLIGKVATFRWLGRRVWPGDAEAPLRATITFLIGFAIVTLLYMVPVIGVLAFALLGVLGLGAASLACVTAFRKEQPPAPQVPLPSPPGAPPVVPPPLDASGFALASGGDTPKPVAVAPPLAAPAASVDAAWPRAAFRDRLAALVLDVILVLLVVQVTWPFRGGRVFFLALLAYHIGFWAWKQTTIGGIICQLRIVRVDGVPLAVADAIVRGLSAIFSVVVVGLGFFWALRDPERQSWHDKIAGTYVVKVPRAGRG